MEEIIYRGPDISFVSANLHAFFNYTFRVIVFNQKYSLLGTSTETIKIATDPDGKLIADILLINIVLSVREQLITTIMIIY